MLSCCNRDQFVIMFLEEFFYIYENSQFSFFQAATSLFKLSVMDKAAVSSFRNSAKGKGNRKRAGILQNSILS